MSNLQQRLERVAVAALSDSVSVSRDERQQFRESFRVFLRRLGPLDRLDPREETAAPEAPGAAISI